MNAIEAEVVPLTRLQVGILQDLADRGPTKASRFVEEELDELFKMKPRLIALVRGFDDAVVDITSVGRQRLIAHRHS